MPRVVVSLSGPEITRRETTDRSGLFTAGGLPPGRYEAKLELPPGFEGSVVPAAFDLPDARACVELSATVKSSAVLTGRVVDSAGRALAGLTVEVTVAQGIDSTPGPERIRTLTLPDGTFELRGVPPGTFVVGVNTAPGATPRVIYPGVDLLRDAQPVTMRAGVDIRLDDFVVPARFSFAPIEGIVVDAAGRPAEGARVFLAGPEPGDHILGGPAITDMLGRFVLTAAAGQEYSVFAERARSGGTAPRLDVSVPVRVAVTGTAHPSQKLTLRALH
jgi:hypothetical protein